MSTFDVSKSSDVQTQDWRLGFEIVALEANRLRAEVERQQATNLGLQIQLGKQMDEIERLKADAAWVPVSERLPESGKTVLAYYRNSHNLSRRIRAKWVASKTEESGSESDFVEYDEASDTYYDPEGWYEQIDNWDVYSAVAVTPNEITHWMPMPPGPNAR